MANIPGLKGTEVFFGDPAQPLPDWRKAADDSTDNSGDPTPQEKAAVASVLGFDPAELWPGDTGTVAPAAVASSPPPDLPKKITLADALLAFAETDVPAIVAPIPWGDGPACLAAVAQRFNIDVSLRDLRADLGATPTDSTPPETMLEGCRHLGLQADGRERMTVQQLQDAVDADSPVIVCVQAGAESENRKLAVGRWVVVTGMRTGERVGRGVASITIMDPADGEEKKILLREFERRWVDQDAGGKVYAKFGITVRDAEP